MINITKIGSKGQVVIPKQIMRKMKLKKGSMLLVFESGDFVCLKRIELSPIKNWEEATKPFRAAAKKSGFTRKDLDRLIEKHRKIRAVKDEFKDTAKFSENSLKQIWDNKEDEIWNKYLNEMYGKKNRAL